MARRWQCTVCGYIHVGPEPPEVCPVCGADRSKFIPLDAPASSLWRAMHATFRVHPVAAHFPGGLIPAAALFLPISIVLGNAALESAVFWLILLATAVVPVSVGSGIHDWRKYFGGRRAPIFFKKLGLAATLFTLGLLALFLRYGPPELAAVPGWPRVLWLALLAGMLACVVLLGHYGALLAAQRRDAQPSPEQPVSSDPGHDWARGIVTEAADAILAADTTGTIRLWNRGAERIFGVPAAAAIGQSLDLVIPEIAATATLGRVGQGDAQRREPVWHRAAAGSRHPRRWQPVLRGILHRHAQGRRGQGDRGRGHPAGCERAMGA